MTTSSFLLQQLINAVFLGSIFSLIALGYTMVYGVLKLINFAHGTGVDTQVAASAIIRINLQDVTHLGETPCADR